MSKRRKNLFINKAKDGLNNLCGKNVSIFRSELRISQRELADRLQLAGLDIDKNAIQRIECGKRFVTDIEIVCLAGVLGCTVESLLYGKKQGYLTTPVCKFFGKYCVYYFVLFHLSGQKFVLVSNPG